MTLTSAIVLPQTQDLEVDTSVIDTSEVTLQKDKDFLMERGTHILRVVAKAALLVGEQLVAIQNHFKQDDNPNGVGLGKFYLSLGISPQQAQHWSNKYRAYVAFTEIFGDIEEAKTFENMGAITASKLWGLPTAYRESFLLDIAEGNPPPTSRQLMELGKQPEVKLSKAEELLAAAKKRKEVADLKWEAVKADPDISAAHTGTDDHDPTYQYAYSKQRDAAISVENFEQQIADLQAKVEAEKLKTAEETEEKTRVQTELQRLKYDDASARAERVKRVGSSLTMSIPQTLADTQKFFAEINDYPEEVRHHLVEQATILANYIGDQL